MTAIRAVPAQAAPTGSELPLFVVATHKVRERTGPPPRAWVPYGVQHAWRAGTRRTLCGVWIAGWDVFWDRRFATTSTSSCRACIEASLPESARSRLAPLAATG
jgi:hypothetical protein